MSRPLLPLAVLVCAHSVAMCGDTKPDPVERALAVQSAMATADKHLASNAPAAAAAVLEAQLANADGNPALLDRLRRAYTTELRQLEAGQAADPNRVTLLRRKLDQLGSEQPSVTAPVVAPPMSPAHVDEASVVAEARALFKDHRYAAAAEKFAAAFGLKAAMTQEEIAAWAYCRVRVAAEAVNNPRCDALMAAAAEKDVAEALKLGLNNAELQRLGQAVLAVARQRQANPGQPNPWRPNAADGPGQGSGVTSEPPVPTDWGVIETANFSIRFQGQRDAAEEVSRAAEARRAEVFKKWGGGLPGGNWSPRCEIVLHPSAESYARMTGKPSAGTGHATVKVADGRPTDRRIDLRVDDVGVLANTLPRELTYVVLVDLFPYTPPPKWAEVGMATLAGSPEEIARFTRQLPRCGPAELLPMATLLDLKEFPAAEKITGFYCQSVTLVNSLVRMKGEAAFTLFLRGCQRYGTARALKEHYGIDNPQSLEQLLRQAAPGVARGQAP